MSLPSSRLPSSRAIAGAALAIGVVVCLVTLAANGAAAALLLADPGPIVRWGQPLVRTVHDLAAALTIGALLVGGFLVPEAARTDRRARCARLARWAALIWGVAGLVGGLFAYALVAGQPLGSSGFWSGWWDGTWQLEVLRAPAITSLAALALAAWLAVRPDRGGMAWAFFGGLLALYPLALTGHAAGSTDHETAVDSLLLHLGAVTVWAGGLAAIMLLWRHLGKGAAITVQRFSKVATWCYPIVGLSGLLQATLRLDDWAALGSAYGVVLLLKVVAFVVLGAIAWEHRRRFVARLAESEPKRAAFARLAFVEVLVMAVAIGLATALARSAPDEAPPITGADPAFDLTGYPTPAPITPERYAFGWQPQWLMTTLAVVAVGVYLGWVLRLRRRGDHWPVIRTISWVVGWVIFAWMVSGGPAIYGRVMFSAHMGQHMVISMLVPIFLVRGGVVTLMTRAVPKRTDHTLGPREIVLGLVHSRPMAVLSNPVISAVIVLGTLIAFYYTPWFEFSLRTHTGHLSMIVHFLLSGYLYAGSLVGIDPGPAKWAPPVRMLVLLVTIAFHAFFGVAMMTGTALLGGEFFTLVQLPWVPDPLVDQQRAGTVAWGAGELPTLMLAMLLAAEWYRRDQADARRSARQADRDDDAELRAYNDYLASRRQP
ncbi:bifunctional copper resistance protein CopD/cytochrome c oxidase assembly protein [Calidifontibacter sp. DB0510]|uniref:Bifunctional copper resistance protein CopD/cytochrome c oxidase assembly protein n=1 Tax=Metallococcus carri TaxID=1656884 RepID=A0A967E9S6_9MICO|nr:cytochrome c oxidase assembly protein [Metallococcus carri]NHN56702.1 bifunctional copper resistance protein CopD/cytochrome c oxidase assembly protein [Metallococcus carri]NOP37921.1 bifunctional copper resistance protein CopD/cytochrome c oxidase assembly protein [Calidifontibacter sp. DB2511S]